VPAIWFIVGEWLLGRIFMSFEAFLEENNQQIDKGYELKHLDTKITTKSLRTT